MNILILSPTYFPLRGGTEQVIFEISKRLIKDNHNITVLATRWEGLKSFEVIDTVDVYRITISKIKGLRLIFQYLSFFLTAIKLNKRKK